MKIMVLVVLTLAFAALLSRSTVPAANAAAASRPARGGITGKIICAYNRKPFVGAVAIYLYAMPNKSRNVAPTPIIVHTKTKATGQFTIGRIPLGIYRIAVRFKTRYGGGEGRLRKPINVTASPACVNVRTIKCAVFSQ